MAKITYLLGAGASAPLVPCSDGLLADMVGMTNHLDAHFGPHTTMAGIDIWREETTRMRVKPLPEGDISPAGKFKSDILKLSNEVRAQTSLDNYAKSLFLKRDQKGLDKLKAALAAYFAMQLLFSKNESTPRYNSFWTALVDDDIMKLPNRVRILSWNYDSQIELSYAQYFNGVVNSAIDNLNIFNNDNINRKKVNIDRFAVYKLNGTAAFHIDYGTGLASKHDIYSPIYNETSVKETLAEIIRRYEQLVDYPQSKIRPSICFAWEHSNIRNPGQTPFINYISQDIQETEVLVSIGYSYPMSNKSVDDSLFAAMPNLKKVYVQNPNAMAIIQSLRSRSLIKIGVETVNLSDQALGSFHIPLEFYN